MAETGYEPGRSRRRPSLLGVLAVAWAVFAFVAFMFIARGGVGDPEPVARQVVVPESPDPERSGKKRPAGSVAKKQDPVNPWCWDSRAAAENEKCQRQVAGATKFVARYQSHQAELAAKHTVVKAGPPGSREANSLARHGLLICWMTENPRVSLDAMVNSFTFAMHPHPYRNITVDGVPATVRDAAVQIHTDALQTVCPSAIRAYERKGGPVVAELAE